MNNNYIVRIYRYDKGKPRNFIGVVEDVGVEGKKVFTNIDELWDILNPAKERHQRVKKKKERR